MRSFYFARWGIAVVLATASAVAAAQNTGTGGVDTGRAAGMDSAGNATGRTMKARHAKKHSSKARHAQQPNGASSRSGGMDGGTSTSSSTGTGGTSTDGDRSNSGPLSPSAGGAQPVTPAASR